MKISVAIWVAAMAICAVAAVGEANARSDVARNHFKALHPCPANGKARGACPGYVNDHVTPLACGGADDPSNMQWQTTAEGRAKDKWERRGCSSYTHGMLNRVRGEANVDEREYLAQEIHIGPRGGRYYLSRSGSKRYIGAFRR